MKKIIISLIYLSLTLVAIKSQSANEIISKYLENTGGIEKWKSLKSLKLSGVFPTPQGDFNFTIYKKSPDKSLTEIDIQGMKLIPQAFDGEVAWALNPLTGNDKPQKLADEMAINIKSEAVFEDPFIDYSAKGHTIIYEGKETVNGSECFKIKLIKGNSENENNTQMYYFDTEYYIPIFVQTKLNEEEIVTVLSDYNDVQGLMIPYSIEVMVGGESIQKINVKKVEINPEIKDEVFKFVE